MKRICAGLLAAALLLSFSIGCGGAAGREKNIFRDGPVPILQVLDEATGALLTDRSGANLPAAVVYTFQGNGEYTSTPLCGATQVRRALDAVEAITVTGETDIMVSDSDSFYTFLRADGTEAGGIAFNGPYLICGDKRYTVENKGDLGKLDFPADSYRDTLALDTPDPQLKTLLTRCYMEQPVGIRILSQGAGERTITDPKTIEAAVNGLYLAGMTAGLGSVSPDTPLFTAVFTMENGSEFPLIFTEDGCYVYEYPAPLGPWSFYLEGGDMLMDALKSGN